MGLLGIAHDSNTYSNTYTALPTLPAELPTQLAMTSAMKLTKTNSTTSRNVLPSVLLSVLLGLGSCTTSEQTVSSSPPSTVDPAAPVSNPTTVRPNVVASHSVLCDLAAAIAQDTIALTCLVAPGEDPHAYQPTPADRKALESAQLIFYGGYDLEPAIETLIAATQGNVDKVAVSEQAVSKPLLGKPHDHDHGAQKRDADSASDKVGDHDHHGHHHDHSHADSRAEGKTAPDPHIWHSAKNGVAMVMVMRDRLKKLSPRNAALYDQNADRLAQQLIALDKWIVQQIETIPADRRKLVTTHDALGYYGQAYGIEILGTLQGLSTTEQPTPTRLKELVSEIKTAKVPTIFAEISTNDRVLSNVAREADVRISEQPIYADGIGQEGTVSGTYVGMLVTNTCTIVNGLGGQCSPFPLE
jgi:manganese/iron transport system substrate-binding protein